MPMHFAFDERQIEFRAQLRALTDKACTAADIRQAWASDQGWSPARWALLADMGVLGLTVPEPYGGLGFGLVDLALLLEEAGRSGLPEPLLDTVGLAVPLLVEAAGARAEALRAQWLPAVAAGEAVLAVGTADTDSVIGAEAAGLLLLERQGAIYALPAAETVRVGRASLDGARRPATVSFDPSTDPVLAADALLADGAEAASLEASLRQRAAMGTAAVLLGVADRLITMAGAYALDRTQFGVPIGSFQAVKHHLANALIRLEFARPTVYRAAWSLDHGHPAAGVHASMAKAMASDAATGAARMALQVHGAIGYTWEHDLHLWMKPAWSLAAAWGDARWHRARVLDELADPDADR
jgi:alkylation response protein AidB-like acyl-CoA dehydrogenase